MTRDEIQAKVRAWIEGLADDETPNLADYLESQGHVSRGAIRLHCGSWGAVLKSLGVEQRYRRYAGKRFQSRSCLRCARIFRSEGPYNRLCGACRESLDGEPPGIKEHQISRPRTSTKFTE